MSVKENLQLLRDYLAQQPEDKINLANYVCGTTFCILGAVPAIPQFAKMGFKLVYTDDGQHADVWFDQSYVWSGSDDLCAIFGDTVDAGLFTVYGDGPENGYFEFQEEFEIGRHDKALALARLDYAISLEP